MNELVYGGVPSSWGDLLQKVRCDLSNRGFTVVLPGRNKTALPVFRVLFLLKSSFHFLAALPVPVRVVEFAVPGLCVFVVITWHRTTLLSLCRGRWLKDERDVLQAIFSQSCFVPVRSA